jgi:hypothetical protein
MSNSEYADPLLRHVATLEKDRTSLETVLEFRNQELTQLRTRINEQVFEVKKKKGSNFVFLIFRFGKFLA